MMRLARRFDYHSRTVRWRKILWDSSKNGAPVKRYQIHRNISTSVEAMLATHSLRHRRTTAIQLPSFSGRSIPPTEVHHLNRPPTNPIMIHRPLWSEILVTIQLL